MAIYGMAEAMPLQSRRSSFPSGMTNKKSKSKCKRSGAADAEERSERQKQILCEDDHKKSKGKCKSKYGDSSPAAQNDGVYWWPG